LLDAAQRVDLLSSRADVFEFRKSFYTKTALSVS